MENLIKQGKEIIKDNRLLYSIAKPLKKGMLFIWFNICKLIYIIFRSSNIDMANFKDKHLGKRCFIVATGPSLSLNDLSLLSNEITFSLNSIVNLFDSTDYRPTYYLIQDGIAEKLLREKNTILCKKMKSHMFMGIGNFYSNRVTIKKSIYRKYYNEATWYNLNYLHHTFNTFYNHKNAIVMFSNSCDYEVFDGYTVTFSAIQLAVYMGFKEIYLLGCDTNHAGHVTEFNDINTNKSDEPSVMMIKAYSEAKKYADNNDIKIFNATRGGMLEVFPRVNLEDIINKSKRV